MHPDAAVAKPRPKRRPRICRACDACYKRKIQCDAATPRCNWCHHHDLPCTFKRNQERNQARSKAHQHHPSEYGLVMRQRKFAKTCFQHPTVQFQRNTRPTR
ncbi:hypothetical protein BO94DRAFT_238336 [Aspergillus sclerotioniger CBS 115572]|uniref:Zn(2)-C6 fungal-type domain-containing protein n=1 Tax=Aspergillus sclerotioniger CBS 115572 TaxID=1450535 RepID=A0A317VHP1_9EURO|nr:hypothetical protein BO94DRAFT_238336 [Aspergillus sclerotioniger CBS 115572]PWY73886.1 hypothetical protein BO94DRAFT_238336 [Aspergillus sclerotioniger CBS 115572]